MSTIGVELQGAGRLVSTLQAAGAEIADMREPNQDAAQAYLDLTRPTMPRRTGKLQASAGLDTISATAAVIVVAAPYSAAVNARRPFLTAPPADTPALINPYITHLTRALSRVEGT